MAVQKRPNFLIVDNDPNDAFFIKRALADSGSTFVCHNPSEAQAYLLGRGTFADRTRYPLPELIFTDLRMDAHCGLRFVEWIRQQSSPVRDTQIVILTGSASREDLNAAEKAGAQAVLEKPSRLENLRSILAGVTEKLCAAEK